MSQDQFLASVCVAMGVLNAGVMPQLDFQVRYRRILVLHAATITYVQYHYCVRPNSTEHSSNSFSADCYNGRRFPRNHV